MDPPARARWPHPSCPCRRNRDADVAQLAEREFPKLDVAGSIPVVRSIAEGIHFGALRNGSLERWVRGLNRRTVNPLPARHPWFESRLLHHVGIV